MLTSDRGLSPRAPRWALFFTLVLSACGSGTPDATPPPRAATAPAATPQTEAADPAPETVNKDAAEKAALVALESLGKRKFDTNGCETTKMRVVTVAVASAGEKASDHCSLLVARRGDRTWLVLIRAAQHPEQGVQAGTAQAGSVQALVSVTPGGEGVTHIDYKP